VRPVLAGLVLSLQALACSVVHAVELSGISVKSRLNEPLSAAIEAKDLGNGTGPATAVISLASAQAHAAAGIPLDPAVTGLIFTLDLLSRPVIIEIESRDPIRTPFLRFLLLVEINGQQVLREYTVMLDPAEELTAAKVATPEREPFSPNASEMSYPGEYVGPVQEGETLMQIARRIKVDDAISIEQTMVALIEDNPDSFIDGNMNLLRKGTRLHIPSERQMARTNSGQARALYEDHLVRWLQRRSEPGTPSPDGNWMTLHAPVAELLTPETDLAGVDSSSYVLRIIQPPGPVSQIDTASAGELFPMSPVSSTADAAPRLQIEEAAVVTALTERLSVVEESLGSKELENQQLSQQVDLLQQQLEKTMQLIELQETQLAIAQQQLETMLAQKAAESIEQAVVSSGSSQNEQASGEVVEQDPVAGSTVLPEQPASEEVASQLSEDVSQSSGATEDSTPDAAAAAAEGITGQPAGEIDEVPPPWRNPSLSLQWVLSQTRSLAEAGRESSKVFWEGLDSNSSAVPGVSNKTLGLVTVFLLLLWLLIKRRRTQAGDSEQLSTTYTDASGSRDLFAGNSVGSTEEVQRGEADPPEESVGAGFVTDTETQRGVAVQSDEVDPLTESEIYLAYGRTVQAEQTLRDAISRTPERIELKLKLLEVLTVLDQKEAFQALANEVRQIVAGGSPEEAHLDKLVGGITDTGKEDTSAPGVNSPAVAIDLPPDAAAGADSSEPDPLKDDGIPFEFDLEAESEAMPTMAPLGSGIAQSDKNAYDGTSDLELDLEVPNTTDDGSQSGLGGVSPTLGGGAEQADPGPDLPDPDPAGPAEGVSEERTQLELANAYLEMGDPAAAREILIGLSHSQDTEIQERAKTLLATITS
jgi:pilus assembly protein FimV